MTVINYRLIAEDLVEVLRRNHVADELIVGALLAYVGVMQENIERIHDLVVKRVISLANMKSAENG